MGSLMPNIPTGQAGDRPSISLRAKEIGSDSSLPWCWAM